MKQRPTHTRHAMCLLLLAGTVIFGACHGDDKPEGVLCHKQIEDFLTEAYRLEADYAIGTNYCYDSINPDALRAYDTILSRLGLTRDEVESSMAYYTSHPDEYAEINEAVADRLSTTAVRQK